MNTVSARNERAEREGGEEGEVRIVCSLVRIFAGDFRKLVKNHALTRFAPFAKFLGVLSTGETKYVPLGNSRMYLYYPPNEFDVDYQYNRYKYLLRVSVETSLRT